MTVQTNKSKCDKQATLSSRSSLQMSAVDDPDVDWRSLFMEGPELRDALEDDSSDSASPPVVLTASGSGVDMRAR